MNFVLSDSFPPELDLIDISAKSLKVNFTYLKFVQLMGNPNSNIVTWCLYTITVKGEIHTSFSMQFNIRNFNQMANVMHHINANTLGALH